MNCYSSQQVYTLYHPPQQFCKQSINYNYLYSITFAPLLHRNHTHDKSAAALKNWRGGLVGACRSERRAFWTFHLPPYAFTNVRHHKLVLQISSELAACACNITLLSILTMLLPSSAGRQGQLCLPRLRLLSEPLINIPPVKLHSPHHQHHRGSRPEQRHARQNHE